MTYIVTSKGPIDRYPPGADVTKVYPPEVLARLVEEGYVIDADAKKGGKRDSNQGHKSTNSG